MSLPLNLTPERRRAYARAIALVAFLLATVVAVSVASQIQPGRPFGIQFDEKTGNWAAQDFASHFRFSGHLWARDLTRPYTEAGHNEMMSRWLGHPIRGALPYGYTPTFALVLAPLLPFPALGAYLLWVLLPPLLVLVMVGKWTQTGEGEGWRVAFLLGLTGLSAAYFRGVQLGQTAAWSLLAVGTILGLVRRDRSVVPGRDGLIGLLLFLLTAKPPLAITVGLALLVVGERRALAFAFGLTVAWIGLVTVWLGTSWLGDYVALLSHYNTQDAPPDLALSLEPIRMTNLRNFLFSNGWADDRTSARWSTVAWIVFCGAAWFRVRQTRRDFAASCALGIAGFEAFCPHLTFTEDVLIAVPAWWWCTQTSGRARIGAGFVAMVLIQNVGPAKLLLDSPTGAGVAFAFKVAVLSALWILPTRQK